VMDTVQQLRRALAQAAGKPAAGAIKLRVQHQGAAEFYGCCTASPEPGVRPLL